MKSQLGRIVKSLWPTVDPHEILHAMRSLSVKLLADAPGSLPHVAAWLFREWWSRHPDNSLSTVVERLEECRNRDGLDLTLVAFDGEIPIGTVTLARSDGNLRPDLTPWLAALNVAPSHRNRGIGGTLVRSAVQHAQRLGEERLYLFTLTAMQFYRDLGWADFSRERIGDRDAFVFVKSVHPA